MPRLKSEYRYQMLIKCTSRPRLSLLLRRFMDHALREKWPATALVVDVDPMSLQ